MRPVFAALLAVGSLSATSIASASSILLPPVNDDCATPTVIAGTGLFPYTLVDATTGTAGQSSPCTGGIPGTTIHRDVWFTWTATTSGLARVETVDLTNMDTKIAVYAGAGCPTGAALACNNNVGSAPQSRVHFDCSAGAVYTIQIGGAFAIGFWEASQLDLDVVVPPVNDDCSAPAAVTGFADVPFDLTLATAGAQTSTAAACLTGAATERDVWFAWTAAQSGPVLIETCGSLPSVPVLDTRIAVFGGSGCALPGTLIACSNDFCSILSRVVFPAVAGQTYVLQVGDRQISSQLAGEGVVRIREGTPPEHDSCATPGVIFGPGQFHYDTTDATTGAEGQSEPACGAPGQRAIPFDLWYAWTANATGTATVSTCDGSSYQSEEDTKIAVYAGAGCPTAPALACNDDDDLCGTWGSESRLTFPIECGETYTIQIGRGIGVTLPTHGVFSVVENAPSCGPTGLWFCTGDGSATPCPCGNAGLAGRGCGNSVNPDGAMLTATGTASLAADSVVLRGAGMPDAACLYFQGTTQQSGGAGVTFGDGLRCAGGTVTRLGTKINVAGASRYPSAGDAPISVRGAVTSPGTRTYQTWYRNAAVFCTASTFNLSNGRVISWTP